MGDIWNKMDEEMSKPRFSGGAMSAYKKYKSKKTDDSEAGGVRSMDVSTISVFKPADRPMQKPMPRANKPKIDLRKSYPE